MARASRDLKCGRPSGELWRPSGKLAPAPRQDPLQPARDDQRTGAPKVRVVEAFDEDFRPAGEPGYRVEVAGVEDQCAGDQLVEGEPTAAAAPREVGGQPPAGVKRPAVDGDRPPAQQRLEAGE